jgi:hypothetical protein
VIKSQRTSPAASAMRSSSLIVSVQFAFFFGAPAIAHEGEGCAWSVRWATECDDVEQVVWKNEEVKRSLRAEKRVHLRRPCRPRS